MPVSLIVQWLVIACLVLVGIFFPGQRKRANAMRRRMVRRR